MKFTDVVEWLKISGRCARRGQWPNWRRIYVSRGSSVVANCSLTVTTPKRPDAWIYFEGHPVIPDYAKRWGIKRWSPLFLDLLATDWELLEMRSSALPNPPVDETGPVGLQEVPV